MDVSYLHIGIRVPLFKLHTQCKGEVCCVGMFRRNLHLVILALIQAILKLIMIPLKFRSVDQLTPAPTTTPSVPQTPCSSAKALGKVYFPYPNIKQLINMSVVAVWRGGNE